jgi:enoyl-CoA hydratase/carnithine racemase
MNSLTDTMSQSWNPRRRDVRVPIFTGTRNTFSAGVNLSHVTGIDEPKERK